MEFSNLLIPAVLFFSLGFLAQAVKSDLKFPPELAKALSIYLLIGIGLKGGIELSHADLGAAAQAVVAALALGFGLPLIAYAILLTSRLDKLNASAIAAHYGSVSAGTFLTAIAYLNAQNIAYETYPVIMLAIMESPPSSWASCWRDFRATARPVIRKTPAKTTWASCCAMPLPTAASCCCSAPC